LMPAGPLVTVPLPEPDLSTDKGNFCITRLKVAVTDWAAFIKTAHGPVPVQAPLQPAKLDPVAGVAVRVTSVALLNSAEHVGPQSMPAGLLATVPLPLPDLETVRVLYPPSAKVAVTVFAVSIVAVHVSGPVGVQEPLHPAKREPDPFVGVAVRVIDVALGYASEQTDPQLMLPKLLVTVPVPLPALVTASVYISP
jgi:hypothetical protein